MRYMSTRGRVRDISFKDAVLMGLADDGGPSVIGEPHQNGIFEGNVPDAAAGAHVAHGSLLSEEKVVCLSRRT